MTDIEDSKVKRKEANDTETLLFIVSLLATFTALGFVVGTVATEGKVRTKFRTEGARDFYKVYKHELLKYAKGVVMVRDDDVVTIVSPEFCDNWIMKCLERDLKKIK